MKKIDFKQQKYILPIILIPFLCLGFYLYKDTFEEDQVVVVEGKEAFQNNISDVSNEVKDERLKDKLEAYQNTYKEADGYTAISGIGQEEELLPQYENLYSQREKMRLDSLDYEMGRKANSVGQKAGYTKGGYNPNYSNSGASSSDSKDDELLKLFINSNNENSKSSNQVADYEDERPYNPMEMMKEQYRFLDSLERAKDPAHLEELKRIERQERVEAERLKKKLNKMTVQKSNMPKNGFNTIKPQKDNQFIKAIVDENVKGYAGSRIRIRLLEDIKVGNNLIKKGTYLYALISGFSEQRVTLKIISVMHQNKILPVNLNIYDLDGMEGLYVPASAFREFSKELGSQSLQGQNMDSGSQQDFLMSTMQKAFQSTSQALSNAIRKNKAKFKYNTYIYLIDDEEMKNN